MATSEPNWQAVLRLLYDREVTPGPGGFIFGLDELSEVVADELNVSQERAKDLLHDMRDFGLLSSAEYGWSAEMTETERKYGLSERGFDLEVRRRQTEAQEQTNAYLVVFTAALVMIALVEALASAPTLSPAASTIIRVVGAVTVGGILVTVWRQS